MLIIIILFDYRDLIKARRRKVWRKKRKRERCSLIADIYDTHAYTLYAFLHTFVELFPLLVLEIFHVVALIASFNACYAYICMYLLLYVHVHCV